MEVLEATIKTQFKTLYGYNLESWQIRATKEFLYSNKDMVIKTPRGGRKSTWMDLMCAHALIHNPQTFAIVATVGIDVAKEHIARIRRFIQNSPFASCITTPNNETEINLVNGSRVLAIPQSADTRVGYHPNLKFVDETSRIDPRFYYATLLPMGRGLDPPARTINVSTPNGMGNVFAELWFKSDAIKIEASVKDCFWISQEELERERKILPHLLFRQECLGEFVTDSGLPFSGVDKIVIEEDPKIDYTHNFVFGIDLARKQDYTVIVVLDMDSGNTVCYMERNQALWQTQIGIITDLYNRFQPVSVMVDATGLGDVVVEALQEAGVMNLTPFVFTAKTKSEIVNNLIAMVENKEVVIPKKFDRLIYELKWWEWDRKDQVDDCVMALALACWAVSKGTTKVEVLDSKLFEQSFLF